jgi:hypothetical protein
MLVRSNPYSRLRQVIHSHHYYTDRHDNCNEAMYKYIHDLISFRMFSHFVVAPSYELEQIAHNTHSGDSSSCTRPLHDQRPRAISLCVKHDDVV